MRLSLAELRLGSDVVEALGRAGQVVVRFVVRGGPAAVLARERARLLASLRRNHPELSEAQLERLLTGEPARRKASTAPRNGWVDNRGRVLLPYLSPGSSGRMSSPRRSDIRECRTDG